MAAPNAYAIQFLDSLKVVFFVRQGREASDEAALRKQIIDRAGAPHRISISGDGLPSTRFSHKQVPDCKFRFIAIVAGS